MDGTSDWNVVVTLNLAQREDTGKINSAPTVSDFLVPYAKFRTNCRTPYTVFIPVSDPDQDVIKCRCTNNACMSGLVLDSDKCTFTFSSSVAGYYVFELLIEDFVDASSTTPLSSVPFQLLAHVADDVTDNCFDGSNAQYMSPFQVGMLLQHIKNLFGNLLFDQLKK